MHPMQFRNFRFEIFRLIRYKSQICQISMQVFVWVVISEISCNSEETIQVTSPPELAFLCECNMVLFCCKTL